MKVTEAAEKMLGDYKHRKREELIRSGIVAQLSMLKAAESSASQLFEALGRNLGKTAFIHDADVAEFEKLIEKEIDYGDALGFAASAITTSHKKSFLRMMLGAAVDLKNLRGELESAKSVAEQLDQNVKFFAGLIKGLISGEVKMVLCEVCRDDNEYYCEHCRGLGYTEVKE